MSTLAEDLHRAEESLRVAEAASDAARKAEIEAIISGDVEGVLERKKRLATAQTNLDAARTRTGLLREAVSVADDREARAQAKAEVTRRIVEQASRQADLDRAEAALTKAYITFAGLASLRHEAANLLRNTSSWLRQNVGQDVPGGLAAPVETSTLLNRLVAVSRAEVASSVSGSEVLLVHIIEVPLFRINPQLTEATKR